MVWSHGFKYKEPLIIKLKLLPYDGSINNHLKKTLFSIEITPNIGVSGN